MAFVNCLLHRKCVGRTVKLSPDFGYSTFIFILCELDGQL